ncbi:inositol 1,4,5-trisphosphate receptor-interacting protein [Diretmus argenteus]
MHDTLLRVFVVALGLIVYPEQDPGVEEWDIITVGMQEYEERLLKEGETLDQETTPINQQTTHVDTEGPRFDLKTIHEEQHESKVSNGSDQDVAQIDNFAKVVEDVTELPKAYFIAELNPSSPQENESDPETKLKTSQEDHEDQAIVLDVKEYVNPGKNSPSQASKQDNIQTSGSFSNLGLLPGLEMEGFRSQKEVSPSHLVTETSEEDNLEKTITDWEKDYLWYAWNTFSIISMIRFFRKCLRGSQKKHEDNSTQDSTTPVNSIAGQVPLPDSDTLHRFHAKCIKVALNERWRKGEFLEGFANELLEAMRTTGDGSGSMVLEDFQMEDVCDVIVPFTPTGPYSFQCQLCSSQESDMLPDMQVCSKVKMIEDEQIKSGCHCESSTGEDTLCLLHCEKEFVKANITDVNDFCMKNTPFLSKSHVTKWFQSTIRQAWAQISHKYEFELSFRNSDAPGALVVRFRSGKRISFNLNPVVKLSDAHFFITPHTPNNFDTLWTLSLTVYEDRLLDHLSRSLPENSCHIHTLEIVYFLHKKQTALTGRSALKDSHFKTTLMHLLLTTAPSQWHPDYMVCRLRDLLVFMEKSLQGKLLHHVLIGNPLARNIELPAALSSAKPVNLFRPLVVNGSLYRSAVMHFQEFLKNAHMLIQDYESSKHLDKSSNGSI